jgi:hypothetical protein
LTSSTLRMKKSTGLLLFALDNIFCELCTFAYVVCLSVTCSAETVRPPTPPTVRASTPDQPEASPVAAEVVKTIATTTSIEAANIASTSTPQIGTSAAKPAPWIEHVSVFLSSLPSGPICV